jgi:phospholipase/carboxylesterase
VRAQSDTQIVAFQDWTLRARASSQVPARLLLLVHGWTGDENSMWVFVQNFPADYWILAPRAPYITEPSGYSWRPSRSRSILEGSTPVELRADSDHRPGLEDLRSVIDSLIGLVDAYALENTLEASEFDLMGFSQGAVMASTIALLHPERVRRVGILSGFIPAGAGPLVAEHPLRGKPFFVAHGTQDETVKIEYARQSVQLLEEAGATVTFCEDEVGHKLGLNCLRALEKFFA